MFPLYGWTTFCSSIHLLMDFMLFSTFCLLWISCEHGSTMSAWVSAFNSLGVYPEVELLDHMVILCLILWGTAVLFSTAAASFYIPTSSVQGSNLPHLRQYLLFSVLFNGFDSGSSKGVRWYLVVVLISGSVSHLVPWEGTTFYLPASPALNATQSRNPVTTCWMS